MNQLIRNAILSLGLFVVSGAIGLGVNALRPEPLALTYEPPGARFVKSSSSEAWKSGIHLVEMDTTQELIAQNGVLVLDARPDLFYEFGHLPNAENLSRKEFEAHFEARREVLNEAKELEVPFLIYCAHEHCEDASKVAEQLVAKGYEPILIFEGGYEAWERAGLKIEEGI